MASWLEGSEDEADDPRPKTVRTTSRLFRMLGVADAPPERRREAVSLWLLHQAASSQTATEGEARSAPVVDQVLVGGLLRRHRRNGDVIVRAPLGLTGGPGRTRLLRRWDQGRIEVHDPEIHLTLERTGGSSLEVVLRAGGADPSQAAGRGRRRPPLRDRLATWIDR